MLEGYSAGGMISNCSEFLLFIAKFVTCRAQDCDENRKHFRFCVHQCLRIWKTIPNNYLCTPFDRIFLEALPFWSLLFSPWLPFLAWPMLEQIASVSPDAGVLSTGNGVLVSLTSRPRDHSQQCGMFKLLQDSSYDLTLGYLAYSRSGKVDLCHLESSKYPYDFSTGEVSCIAGGAESGRKS